MTESVQCSRCGGPLPEDSALGGGCPRCMLELGFETTAGSRERLELGIAGERPSVLGRYRILRLIGEGGMGAVYEAEQDHPRRTVALKIIKSGMASPELLRRFEQESQALGRLQHPGIAQIYEAGTVDTGFGPQPYFAMELIRGRSPREYAEANHLSVRDRLRMMVKICDAVHHAHQRGLIHRDLKPGNILVDEAGQPKILDFGVARVTDSDARATHQTDMGQLIGTLAYMSPEQALADPLDLDTRSDVYSLGVILYELLSGRLPYTVSKKVHEAIQAIREEDPVRLSTSNRTFRGDIETIVAKALEKDRERRYGSAAEMAADIHRYLNDEAIVARPPSRSYQLQKFARRNKGLVLGVAAVFVVLVAGVVASTLEAVRARNAEQSAETALGQVLKAEQTASTAQQRAAIAEEQFQRASQNAAAQQKLADEARDQAANFATQAQQSHDRATAEQRRAEGADEALRVVAVSQSLATQSVRDSASRADDDRAALLARQALLFRARTSNRARYTFEDALQKAGNPYPWSHVLTEGTVEFYSIAFSPDGTRLAAGAEDKSVWVWDARNVSASPVMLRGSQNSVKTVAFSADGSLLAAGGNDSVLRVWDLRNPIAAPVMYSGSQNSVNSITFSPDGLRLAAAGSDNTVRMWDTRNPNSQPTVFHFEGLVNSVAFSPDGAHIAAGDENNNVKMWDLRNSGLPPVVFQGSQGAIYAVAFTPDGTRLAASGAEKNIRMWIVENPSAPSVLFQNQSIVTNIAFTRDGSRLAAAGTGFVRIWDVRNPNAAPMTIGGPQAFVNSIAFSAAGDQLAIAINNADVGTLWISELQNTSTLNALVRSSESTPRPISGPVNALSFSPDGVHVAAAIDQNVRVWDIQNSSEMPLLLKGQQAPVVATSFSSDGARVTGASTDCSVRTWELRSPEASSLILGPKGAGRCLAMSSDGTRLASVTPEDLVRLWNARNPTSQLTLLSGKPVTVSSLLFSADGTHLVAEGDGTLQIWDLRSPGRPPTLLQGERGRFPHEIALSPDASHLAYSSESTVLIWDLRDQGAEPIRLPDILWHSILAFSSDGTRLASVDLASRLTVWDVQNNGTVQASIRLDFPSFSRSETNSIAFSPDNSRLIQINRVGDVHVTRFWTAAADYLCTRVWRNLSISEWRQYVGTDFPYERTCPALPPGAGAPGAAR
jgi:WD40 repeat protein